MPENSPLLNPREPLSEEPGKPYDWRKYGKKQRLSEAEYWAKRKSGEIEGKRSDAHVIRGDALIAKIQEESGHKICCCAFSMGKDSLATYLAIRPKFERVIPYHMFTVPGLEFVEESLRYFERNLTDEPIIRMPHPALYVQLGRLLYQPPTRVAVLRAAKLEALGYDRNYMRELVCEEARAPLNCFVAMGVRATDSPMRRLGIVTHGPINRRESTFLPIWDWNKARTMAAIQESGLRLPVDYDLFGRTLDGIGAQYLGPIRQHYPRDYQKILDWFPLADTDLFREERFGRKKPVMDEKGNIRL
jgi:hypothetical protein